MLSKKYKNMRITFISLFLLSILSSTAQSTFKIANNTQVNMTGESHLVLQNTNFENNGTFTATAGTVKMTGDATTENSTISGTSNTEFYNLDIDKSANDAALGNSITVNNALTLTNECLNIVDYDLTVGNAATLTNTTDAFVRTTGLGSLVREVGSTRTDFPVGNSELNLLSLTNDGTTDNFSVRSEEGVLSNGDSGDLITEAVVNTTWFVNEATEGGSDVSMTATWYENQELTNFDRNNSFIWHYTNSDWQAGTAQTAVGDNPYYVTENNITNFSPFTVASLGVLPIELLSLVALPKGDKVQLEWTTATENNSGYFEVQHSTEISRFEKIGTVEAAGYSQKELAYDFLHHQPMEGLNYYRLKQFDRDGKFVFSSIVSVEFKKDETLADIQVYPNPTKDVVYLDLPNQMDFEISVFDNLGQLLRTFVNKNEINLQDFPAGTYFFKIESKANQAVKIEKVVVQH